ncbi:MAG: monovalent cation/H(+) antiporter subunit G, partial [Rubrivivax sp.]|nr:monovalent cation/H(+) antiporter subunit G [Rubrivivax sp.]
MSVLAAVLLVAGTVLLVIAAWGVVTLPDALARQHAATKAGTLALALVGLGAFVA